VKKVTDAHAQEVSGIYRSIVVSMLSPMMVILQKKCNWVLDALSYKSIDDLIKALKPAIVDPAILKHNELRLIKRREPKISSASDFIDDKGME
jgi:hypothetical protein